MKSCRLVAAVMTLLLSLALTPSLGGPVAAAGTVQSAATALPGTFGLNGGSATCSRATDVDVDIVPGGFWILSGSGSVWAFELGDGPVVEPVGPYRYRLEQGECMVELVPRGGGYWLFTSHGRVFSEGYSKSFGDLSDIELNEPIVAVAPTSSGNGYYMLGADGGVFTFGDARFYGSVQGIVDETVGQGELASDHLHAPIVTMATTPAGYWLIAGDGAVFPFGDAPYHGSVQDALNTGNQLAGIERDWTLRPPAAEGVSLAKDALVSAVVDVVPSGAGAGYMMLASDGGIFNFGQTQFHGSAAGTEGFTAIASDVTASGGGYVILMRGDSNDNPIRLYDFGSVRTDRSTLRGEFAYAAERRQWSIDRLSEEIRSGNWGMRTNVTWSGPGGWGIHFDPCPAVWNNSAGIDVGEIRIGHIVAQLPNGTTDRAVTIGLQNYLDWVNANDPIMVNDSPRRVSLVIKDGGRTASQTNAAIDELLEGDSVFAIHTLGEPATVTAYERVDRECVPHPFAGSPDPALGDPDHHPWSTGLELSYTTEARMWGELIFEHVLPDATDVTVAALVTDNHIGRAYEEAFEEWVDGSSGQVSNFIAVRHDPEANSVSRELQELKDAQPAIFLSMTDGGACLLAMRAAFDSDLLEAVSAAFTPRACSDVATYMMPAGFSADGWLSVGGGIKRTSVATQVQEPFVAWMSDNLRSAGLDVSDSGYVEGYLYGWSYVEALRIAAALPGGLTRTNFMMVIRSLDLHHPLLLDGIQFNMLGIWDGFPIEGAEVRRFDYLAQTWNSGFVIDRSGCTPSVTGSWRSWRCG